MITFIHQDSHYFHSFQHCIKSVRKYYPNARIDFYIDDNNSRLKEYDEFCLMYNCNVYPRSQHQSYIRKSDGYLHNIPKMLESHRRIYESCKRSDDEWILLLEDDVVIKREIKSFPSADCGNNREEIPRPGGGSIFKRQMYINVYERIGESGIVEIIKRNHDCSWAGDLLKEHMFLLCGVSSERWVELAEPDYFDNTDHAVFHGYKELHKLG